MPPKQYRSLQSGTSIEAEPLEILSPGDSIVWAKLNEGNALWMGQEGFSVDKQMGPFPLTRDSFLHVESKSQIDLVDPSTLTKNGVIWQAVQVHLQFVLRYAFLVKEQVANAEIAHLKEMDSQSSIQTREAMARLMGIVNNQN